MADKCMEDAMSELKKKHPTMDNKQMVAIAMSKCGDGKPQKDFTPDNVDEKANQADFAYVPDPKAPSTWKLDISDATHIAGAITALTVGFRGNKVEIPAADKPKVISRIRAAINKLSDDMQKQNLLDRLSKVKSTEKDMTMLSQAETNYGAANGQTGKACSNCRWFCPADDMEEAHCHLVADDPAPITPNGLCDRWEETPDTSPAMPAPIPVTIVEPMDSEEMALPTKAFWEALKESVEHALKVRWSKPAEQPAFSVFKALDGKYYWIARHTGKWIDREHEIITDKAHEDYVARVQSGAVPMPELWTWHKKGTRHGQADMVWKSGGFILAVGHFDDTPQAQRAIAFYQKNSGKIKLSHMFNYPTRAKQGRVFHAYNTVEITTLPDGAEAFPYTSFEEIRPMLTDTQRAFIKELGGDEMLQRVEAADTKAVDDTKALDALGVESKGLDNFEGSELPGDKDVEALKSVQSDIETRLKSVEETATLFKTMETVIKQQDARMKELENAAAVSLEKANALELQLKEYQTIAPPASKSDDTILSQREKSIIEQAMSAAKTADTPSIVEMAMGKQPEKAAQ